MLLNCKQAEENKYNEDEIIFVVDMNTNESKSDDDIAKFSELYTEAIDKNEPNSLGWGFYNSNEKYLRVS